MKEQICTYCGVAYEFSEADADCYCHVCRLHVDRMSGETAFVIRNLGRRGLVVVRTAQGRRKRCKVLKNGGYGRLRPGDLVQVESRSGDRAEVVARKASTKRLQALQLEFLAGQEGNARDASSARHGRGHGRSRSS